MQENVQRLLTVSEVAARLGLAPRSIWKLLEAGHLKRIPPAAAEPPESPRTTSTRSSRRCAAAPGGRCELLDAAPADLVHSACDAVRAATEDAYGDTAYRQAFRLGFHAVGGVSDVEAALIAAAVQGGLPERVARTNVLRGLRQGEERSRSAPNEPRRHNRSIRVWHPTAEDSDRVSRVAVYPPADELHALLAACTPVRADPEVSRWVRSRGFDPDHVDLEVGVRCLPPSLQCPKWARGREGVWTRSGHRCLFPVHDATGSILSVRARYVGEGATEFKSLAPMGYAVRGTVFADGMAQLLLGGTRPPTWNNEIVVVEGEPDFASWCINRSDSTESTFAVFGVFAGAWSRSIAERVPSGAIVALRTDCDPAGDAYAAGVIATLQGRCRVHRLRGDAK